MDSKKPVRVLVPGAAGQIELVRKFAGGYLLGADQPVILHLLDIPSAAVALNGLKKELVDGAFPLLVGVVATTDVDEACTRVNIAVVDVGLSREIGTETNDLKPSYKSLALALGSRAAADLEIWAVGDPVNANDLFLESSILGLDHYLAERLNVPANRVENANICGNRPATSYPDTNSATVKTPNGGKSVHELPADGARMDEEFIIKASKCSSAMSAASSAWDLFCDWVLVTHEETLVSMGEDSDGKRSSAMSAASFAWHRIRDWLLGTHEETLVSMGKDSDGSHSVPAGRNGRWSIVEDLGTPTPAIFQSEVEGKIKQTEERLEMISYRLTGLENREGDALHHYSAILDEFDRHADRAFENLCNKIEFLQKEIANLQWN